MAIQHWEIVHTANWKMYQMNTTEFSNIFYVVNMSSNSNAFLKSEDVYFWTIYSSDPL